MDSVTTRSFVASNVTFRGAVVGADALVDKYDNAYQCCQVIALTGDEAGHSSNVTRSYREGSVILEASMPGLRRGDKMVIQGFLLPDIGDAPTP